MSATTIYGLVDPRNNELRYIGLSKNPVVRRYQHVCNSQLNKTTHKNNWIKSLKSKGLSPEMFVIEEVNNSNVSEAEIFWISYFKSIGANLTNGTSGGDGIHDLSKESRMRCGDFRRGKKFIFSDDHIENMKASKQKRMEDPALLEETKERFSKIRNVNGHKWTNTARLRASISAKRRDISKEERLRISHLGVQGRIKKYKRTLSCVVCGEVFEAIDVKAIYCSGKCNQRACRKRKKEVL